MPSRLQTADSQEMLRSELRAALNTALPEPNPPAADAVAMLLADAAAGTIAPDEARQRLAAEPELGACLRALAGRDLRFGSTLISFGEGSQVGDISIGDIAGRDLIRFNLAVQQTIVAPAQRYDVRGLPSPYRGLRPFTYADHTSFAGRERLVGAGLARLTTPGAEQALLFVSGPSGSGKSSFVQAGLLPALDAHYTERGLALRHAVMRPSQQPLAALADALRQLGIAPTRHFAVAAPFVLGPPAASRPDIAVLVIDQFEELFTQSAPDQRDALLQFLAALPAFRTLRTHLLCTLRSDFLAELAEAGGLEPAFREQLLLRAMDEQELRDAIQRPLQQNNAEKQIEPALLDRLVKDADGEPCYLPLLQVTLDDLWRRGSLTLGAYTSLTDAIRSHARKVYQVRDYDGARQQPRDNAEQALILSLFLDLVDVSLDDKSRRDVRRRRALAELTRGELERARLVTDLVDARLLSTGVEQRDGVQVEVVDIIHESLIDNWDQLKEAIHSRRETLQWRVRFELALSEWQKAPERSDLLLRGPRLVEANELDQQHDVALNSDQARAFLSASQQLEVAEQRREAAEQHRAELLRLAGGVAATGIGFGAGFVPPVVVRALETPGVSFADIPSFVLLTGLYMFPIGVLNGLAIALALALGAGPGLPAGWVRRLPALLQAVWLRLRRRPLLPALAGAAANALGFALFIFGPLDRFPDYRHALSGAIMGACLGFGASLGRSRWPAGLVVAGGIGFGAAALLTNLLTSGRINLAAALVGGLILGAIMSPAFRIVEANDGAISL